MPKAYFTFAEQIFHSEAISIVPQERISLKKAPLVRCFFCGRGRRGKMPSCGARKSLFSLSLGDFCCLVATFADRDNITEQLKATDQMEWVRRMNAARAAATEIVNSELIYR